MPDFGYGKDNYLIGKDDEQNSGWQSLVGIVGKSDKFTRLKNFIHL